MESESRQAQHSAATRGALIRAARRLFAEHGYAGAGTEEVVRRARVTRGALYHHFRDKRDLFAAVLDEEQKKLAAKAASAAASAPDPFRAMRVAANSFLEACLDPAVQRIVLIDAPAVLGPAQFRQADQGYYLDALKALLGAAIAQGLIDEQPVGPLAHLLFGAMHEAALLIADADDKAAAKQAVIDAVGRLFDGVRKRAAG
jgi:AcrR family transcriptional regulator